MFLFLSNNTLLLPYHGRKQHLLVLTLALCFLSKGWGYSALCGWTEVPQRDRCTRPLCSLLAHVCAISEVVGRLSRLPPLLMFSSVLCVCPAHPLPFNPPPPVYHDNRCLQRRSPMYSPDHRWLLAGAHSLLQPTPDHKEPGRTGLGPPVNGQHHTCCVCRLHYWGRRQDGGAVGVYVRGDRGGVWFYVPNRIDLHFEWTGKLLRTNCSAFNSRGRIKEMVDDQIVSRPDMVIAVWVLGTSVYRLYFVLSSNCGRNPSTLYIFGVLYWCGLNKDFKRHFSFSFSAATAPTF